MPEQAFAGLVGRREPASVEPDCGQGATVAGQRKQWEGEDRVPF